MTIANWCRIGFNGKIFCVPFISGCDPSIFGCVQVKIGCDPCPEPRVPKNAEKFRAPLMDVTSIQRCQTCHTAVAHSIEGQWRRMELLPCWITSSLACPTSSESRQNLTTTGNANSKVPRWTAPAQLNWRAFHKQGVALTIHLKAIVGDDAVIGYMKPIEDPGHERDEQLFIPNKADVAPLQETSFD